MGGVVVLDRDGVINADSAAFIKSPAEWRPLPGSLAAIAALHRAGLRVVVASNQSGLARGLFDQAVLEAIHGKMLRAVEAAGGRLHGVYYCPHGPDQGCDCRKPAPGLLRRIATDFQVAPDSLIMVGDAERDLQAAWALGARAVLVLTGKGRQTLETMARPPAEVYPDLAAAARQLLQEKQDVQP